METGKGESQYNGALPSLLQRAIEAPLCPAFWNAHRMRLRASARGSEGGTLFLDGQTPPFHGINSPTVLCGLAVCSDQGGAQVENCIWGLELMEPRTQGLPMGSGLRP